MCASNSMWFYFSSDDFSIFAATFEARCTAVLQCNLHMLRFTAICCGVRSSLFMSWFFVTLFILLVSG